MVMLHKENTGKTFHFECTSQDIPGVSLLRIRFPLHACTLQGGEGDQETRERREAVRENEISVWETACFIQFSQEESEVRVFNEMIRSPALFAATITEVARRRSEVTRRACFILDVAPGRTCSFNNNDAAF